MPITARESRGYYGVNPNPFGQSGYYDQRGYYYYDNNGRYAPAPRDSWRPPGQFFGQGSYGRDQEFRIREFRRRRRAIRMVASTKHRSASIRVISGAAGDTTERQHDEEPEAGRLARGRGGLCRDVRHAAMRKPKSVRKPRRSFGSRRSRRPPGSPSSSSSRKSIAFIDRPSEELIDPDAGLIRFEDWAQARPIEKQFLSPFPSYLEPTVELTVDGVRKRFKEKLHMYVGEARFVLARPPASLDLASFVSLPFVERIDPAIKHRLITSAEAVSPKDPRAVHNQHPLRRWCETRSSATICIRSRYQFEGKLPLGIQIANKLRDGSKKIADYLEFESELTLRSPAEVTEMGLATLTGLDTPPVGALEQNIFYVNQVMQFGKLLAVFQRASDRPEPDRRHRVHGAGGREQPPRQEEGVHEGAGAAKSGAGPGACRQELVQHAATRSAPGCRSTRATRSRRSRRSSSASETCRGSRKIPDCAALRQVAELVAHAEPHRLEAPSGPRRARPRSAMQGTQLTSPCRLALSPDCKPKTSIFRPFAP